MNDPCKQVHNLDSHPDNDPHSHLDRDPVNFALCKWGISDVNISSRKYSGTISN